MMSILRFLLRALVWFLFFVVLLNLIGWILCKCGVLDRVVFDFDDEGKKKEEGGSK